MNLITYRVYADGSVMNEDEFGTLPEDHSDDYATYRIPEELVDYLRDEG